MSPVDFRRIALAMKEAIDTERRPWSG